MVKKRKEMVFGSRSSYNTFYTLIQPLPFNFYRLNFKPNPFQSSPIYNPYNQELDQDGDPAHCTGLPLISIGLFCFFLVVYFVQFVYVVIYTPSNSLVMSNLLFGSYPSSTLNLYFIITL